jgi:hypothetical protein
MTYLDHFAPSRAYPDAYADKPGHDEEERPPVDSITVGRRRHQIKI